MTTDGSSITVENNRQPLTSDAIVSTRVGLDNIRQRYKLLGNTDITIKETADTYSVSLPIIKSKKK